MKVQLCIVVISLLFSRKNCERRIFGGKDAGPGQFPEIVRLDVLNLGRCTGSIIHKEWVLSAAHCVVNKDGDNVSPRYVTITAGSISRDEKSGNQQTSLGIRVIHHEKYSSAVAKHDLSLIKLETPFTWNAFVQKGNIFKSNWPQDKHGTWENCIAAGFGVTEKGDEKTLKYLKTSAIHGKNSCPCVEKGYQLKRIICLPRIAEEGVCFGDSGGPLLCDSKIVGVAHVVIDKRSCSYKSSPDAKVNCGSKHVYGVYTFVCPYISWISRHVPDIPAQPESCKGNVLKSSLTHFVIFHIIFWCNSIV